MTLSVSRTYECTIDVRHEEIDEQGRVNNAVYLKWVQDAVVHQWKRLAPQEAVASTFWVALKHEINYRRPAFLDDRIDIHVLLEKLSGARAFFKTLIERNGEVLAVVESCWCSLDAATQKPVRLAQSIVTKFLPISET